MTLQVSGPAQPGYYTEDGFPEPVACLPGFYQDETEASSCKQCEKGKYCDELNLADGKDCATLLPGHNCD